MEWQSIETAPKDGTWIVIGKPNWRVFPKAKWAWVDGDEGQFPGWLFEDDVSGCLVPNVDGEGFLGWQEDIEDGNMPTHWMPVPA